MGVLGTLVVFVIALMVLRDMGGPEVNLCVEGSGDTTLSKHLHCVSRNGTRSFADFLATQGAKKEHPLYAMERARLRSERNHHQHLNRTAGQDQSAVRKGERARAATPAIPAAALRGGGSHSRIHSSSRPDQGDDEFLDPAVRRAMR